MVTKMVEKIISGIIAASTFCSMTAFAAFSDVSEYSASYKAINELEQLEIVDGDENGNFNPGGLLTRAEFAKLVVSARGEDNIAQALTKTSFKDCENHWAKGYIETGVTDGFINGYDDTTFGPDDTVTYEQALKMLVNCIGYSNYAEGQGGYPAGYLSQASKIGITKNISGASNSTLITRELAAVLIDNTIKIPICAAIFHETYTKNEIMNGKEGREYATLLTARHDAYIVKGKVIETRSLNKGLDKDEVTYQIEISDNFDGKVYNETTEPVRMKVGITNAKELLFYYTEALVQKGDISDEYTILTINER